MELTSLGPVAFDLRWTTVAGGSGTIEDIIKTPERETAQVPLVQGPRVNVYVEGSYNDWVVTTEEFKRLEEDFWIDSLLANTDLFIDSANTLVGASGTYYGLKGNLTHNNRWWKQKMVDGGLETVELRAIIYLTGAGNYKEID